MKRNPLLGCESNGDSVMIDGEKKFTLYCQRISLEDIAKDVERYMVTHKIQHYEIVQIWMRSGLPHCDYGQTIEVTYRERDATKFPAYEKNYKDKALFAS